MARKVLVRLVDDLDGLPSEGVATVTFSLDGVSYQIDLNETNASKLRDGLADFISAARRTGGRMKRGSAGGRASANDGPAIREWAREQGHELAERGRIPSHIVDAFHAANRGGRRVPAKAAAAAKTAVAKATAPTGKATRGGARPAAAKAPAKAPATKRGTAAKATAAKSTAKTAAKSTKAAATARAPRATKSTVTAKTTGTRGRKA